MVRRKKQEITQTPKFTKEQILKSNRFAKRRDYLKTVLTDEEKYAAEDIAELIKEKLEEEI